MRYRLGRKRRRNLYVQHGPEPTDDDLFVALFDDEHMAAKVMRLLNGLEEAADKIHTAAESRLWSQTTEVFDPREAALECANPTCGHPRSEHSPMGGPCYDPDPACTCVEFVRPGDLIEQEIHNPFCQRDGCIHHRSQHAFGSGYCRDCDCRGFEEATHDE